MQHWFLRLYLDYALLCMNISVKCKYHQKNRLNACKENKYLMKSPEISQAGRVYDVFKISKYLLHA